MKTYTKPHAKYTALDGKEILLAASPQSHNTQGNGQQLSKETDICEETDYNAQSIWDRE